MFELITAAISAVFAAGGAYAAVRVRLHYLEKDLTRVDKRVEYAHERIDLLL